MFIIINDFFAQIVLINLSINHIFLSIIYFIVLDDYFILRIS